MSGMYLDEEVKTLKDDSAHYLVNLRKHHDELMLDSIPSENLGEYIELVKFFSFIESEIRGMRHQLNVEVFNANFRSMVESKQFEDSVFVAGS